MNATLNMVTWIFLASLFSVSGYLYLKDKKAAEKSLSKGAGIKEIMSFSATPSVAALLKFFIAVLCLWAAGQIGYAFIGKTTFSTGIAGTAVAVDGIGSAVKSGASWVGDAVSGFSTEPVGVQDVLELVEEKSLISVDVSGAPISGGNAAVAPSAPVAAPAAPVAPVESAPTEPESVAPASDAVVSADTGAALASAAPAPAAMVGPAAPGNVTVARGDTLFAIAQRVYGDGEMWPALCAANPALKAAGCDTIVAGQNLLVPPADYAQTVNRTQVGVTAAAASVAPQAPAYGPVAKPATYTAPNVGHYATPEGGSWGLVVVGSETK